MRKRTTSFALSEEALRLLDSLAARMGLTKTGTLEFLVRDRCAKEGLRGPATPLREKPR